MAKIAEAVDRALARRAESGGPTLPETAILARGEGWTVADVVCAAGPRDRPFEEEHGSYSLAMVVAGTFQYRSTAGSALMTPGSVMIGNAGQRFECSHDHGSGDRCIAFWYDGEYLECIAADAGLRNRRLAFRHLRVPPIRALAPIVARACAGVTGAAVLSWEELGVQLAGRAVGLLGDASPRAATTPANASARVARVVRGIDRRAAEPLSLGRLARAAGLSPFHFLRTFERVTGVTPHQYILRARLREAARRIATERGRILDVVLDCGFGDVSNFNRTFRAEFGVSPRRFRV